MFPKKTPSNLKMSENDHRRLFLILENYKTEVYALKCDSETNRRKRVAWLRVCEEFNKNQKPHRQFSVQKLVNHFRNSSSELKKAQKEGRELPFGSPTPKELGYEEDDDSNESYESATVNNIKEDVDGEEYENEDPLTEASSAEHDNTSDMNYDHSKGTSLNLTDDIPEGVLVNVTEYMPKRASGKLKKPSEIPPASTNPDLYSKLLSPVIKSRLELQAEQQRQKTKIYELDIKRAELAIQLLQEQIKQGRHYHVNRLQRDQEMHELRMKNERELHELRLQTEQRADDGQQPEYNNKLPYSIMEMNH